MCQKNTIHMHGCIQFCQLWSCVLCICSCCALTDSCYFFRSCHRPARWTVSFHCWVTVFKVEGWQSGPGASFCPRFFDFSFLLMFCCCIILYITVSWNVPWLQLGCALLRPWAWEALLPTEHVAGLQSWEVYCCITQWCVLYCIVCLGVVLLSTSLLWLALRLTAFWF